jgi:hypothetical protein
MARVLPPDVTIRDVAKMMQMPGEIDVKDRSTFFNRYPNCFVGKDAVAWLLKRNLSKTRDDAVAVGRRLLAEGFVYNVSHDKDFQDSASYYYSFSSTLNETSGSPAATLPSAAPSGSSSASATASSSTASASASASASSSSSAAAAAVTTRPRDGTAAAPPQPNKSTGAGLPKLRGQLEVWEENGGLFSSSWKRRYYVLDRKTKQLLFYPETMEQALGFIDMTRIAMIGPTGDGWAFQIMVEIDVTHDDDRAMAATADEVIDGKPYKRTLLRARSHEELTYWVDNLIRWVDVFRTMAKQRDANKATKPPKDEKTTLLSAIEARAEARIAAASTRRADEAVVAQQQLQTQLGAAQEQLAAADKRVAELLVALNEARAQLLRSSDENHVRTKLMQTNDDVRHLTIKCQETQTKLDRALEELAARPAATTADTDDVAELKRALEEQFQVLDEMRAKLTASEQRTVELEAENELLLERLAELEIAAEDRGEGEAASEA